MDLEEVGNPLIRPIILVIGLQELWAAFEKRPNSALMARW